MVWLEKGIEGFPGYSMSRRHTPAGVRASGPAAEGKGCYLGVADAVIPREAAWGSVAGATAVARQRRDGSIENLFHTEEQG